MIKNQFKKTQRGLVLFVALIALAVMSLAAVGLIRSVDTSVQIAGNLEFKQNATIASNIAFEAMADTIGAQAVAYSYGNTPGDGYYASCTSFDLDGADVQYAVCGGNKLTEEASWGDDNSQLADGVGIENGQDKFGNEIRYIVERMTTEIGEMDDSKTILASFEDPDQKTVTSQQQANTGRDQSSVKRPVYRVTIRIKGPKNTISYMQTYMS